MEFKEVVKRALEIKEKYVSYERREWGKEWTSEQIAEGFVGDVGDLIQVIMAKEGVRKMENVDENLKHELSDCLWAILVLASKYGVDMESTFMEQMDKLEKRIDDLG